MNTERAVLTVELSSDNRKTMACWTERCLNDRVFSCKKKSMSCSTNDVVEDHAEG